MTMLTEYGQSFGNGKDGQHITVWPPGLVGNTVPTATRGSTLGSSTPLGKAGLGESRSIEETLGLFGEQVHPLVARYSGEGGLIADAKVLPRAKALKPRGEVVLFQRIMEDWSFSDEEAATLLGFEAALDIDEIYRGSKPVGHRDANDRLRAVLRIATDLNALFQDVDGIRDWLSEGQLDLNSATPRSLLTEGSMENVLRVKSYVSYLSGRS
jgi:hypothetical protein